MMAGSHVELARRRHFSAAVPAPVRALEEAGFIKGYRGLLDEKLLATGTVFAMVHLTSSRADSRRSKISSARGPLVRECWMLSGEIDFVLKCVAPDLKTFRLRRRADRPPHVRNVRPRSRCAPRKTPHGADGSEGEGLTRHRDRCLPMPGIFLHAVSLEWGVDRRRLNVICAAEHDARQKTRESTMQYMRDLFERSRDAGASKADGEQMMAPTVPMARHEKGRRHPRRRPPHPSNVGNHGASPTASSKVLMALPETKEQFGYFMIGDVPTSTPR